MSDREVRSAVADGARTVDEVAQRCGAGAECGGCHPLLHDLLHDCDSSLLSTAS